MFSVFFFGSAAFCFVGGYASDRIGGRNVFAIAAVVCSVILRPDQPSCSATPPGKFVPTAFATYAASSAASAGEPRARFNP